MTRVLVVDDCPNMRKMLCEMLTLEGHETLTARDGQEALEILWKSEEPLVALLDYMMQWMTGVDTLRYLAEDPARAQRHAIVLMSANTDYPRMAAEVFPYAPLPFLAKPFTVDQFLDTLSQAGRGLLLSCTPPSRCGDRSGTAIMWLGTVSSPFSAAYAHPAYVIPSASEEPA